MNYLDCFYCKKPLKEMVHKLQSPEGMYVKWIEEDPGIKYLSCDCNGMTLEQEIEEMELYNRKNNEKLSNREVKNLITCPECKGQGGYFSSLMDEPMICIKCCGKKYIKLPDPSYSILKDEEFKKIFRPINDNTTQSNDPNDGN